MNFLDKIFSPKTIAVIGASDEEGSVGYALFKNLISSDYDGIVYPVNIKRKNVQSIKAYPRVLDLPDKIDLAVIATPASTVLKIIEECGQAGVGGVVIISAGFQETGRAGEILSSQILKLARQYNLRVVGPNCLGFIKPKLHLNASFANKMALAGKIAFISQSGALCTAILDWSVKNNVGFSYFVSIGSMIDVGFHDLIDYFDSDSEVSSILLYMETLTEARKFLSAARAFSRTKPIFVLKAGRSSEGAKAAKSHTGSLAGNDKIFTAAFERAGVIRVDTILDLFHGAKALAIQPKPLSNRLTIITNAGGPGVIATDALINYQGRLTNLAKSTIDELNKFLPTAWSHSNPIDILGDADAKRYQKTIEICLDEENTDAILVILTPQAMTNPAQVAKELVALQNKIRRQGEQTKTIMAAWMGGDDVAEGRQVLEEGNIPVYRTPEDAIQCFKNIVRYAEELKILYQTPATIPHAFSPDTQANKVLLDKIIKTKRTVLTEIEAKTLLHNYEIPVLKHTLAQNPDEAAQAANNIGFPVVMKILSPDIIHKTDIGGVKLNVNSATEAKQTYNDLIAVAREHYPQATILGVLVETMINKRYELLIGCQKDPIFGPAIVFGMGGVAVEIFQDTKVGLPPLNMSLSMRLIEGTKIYRLLKGYRGMSGVDIQAIQFLLYKFAYLVMDFPEIKEIDINPLAIDEAGGVVLDAKVILDEKIIGKKVPPYSHLVISPYPKEYVTEFKMKNGKIATLRPIRPEDEPLEAEMFTHFSPETERQRFFGPIGEITHDLLLRYTQIDYDREIAIIAELTKGSQKKMIGVVRLMADPYGETAEFAVVVADPWQGQGLGNKFLDYILVIAKERGIKEVYAKFYKNNKAIYHMLAQRRFEFKENGELFYAELKL